MATRPYFFAFGSGSPATTAGLAPTFIYFVNTSGATILPPAITQVLTGSGLYLANYSATQTIAFILDGATTGLANSDRYISGVMDPYDLFGITMTAIGDTTIALGTSNIALGTTNVALGITQIGQGVTLTAIGFSTLVYGSSLTAQGITLTAIGFSTLVYGSSLTAQGVTLTAIGFSTLVYGNSLMAQGSTLFGFGVSTIAFGVTSIAIGTSLTAQGVSLFALGTSSVALGSFIGSTASSFGTTGIDPSTVIGFLKRAQEIAEGNQTYTKSTGVLDLLTRGSTLLREKTISDTSATTTKS